MDRFRTYKVAMIVVPILACLFGTGLIIFEAGRVSRLKANRAQLAGEIASLTRQIQETAMTPSKERYPTVPQSPSEQPQFLTTLRSYADSEHVQIMRWTNAPAAPSATGIPDDKTKKAQLPANVSTIVSTIEITGRYSDARKFLYDLLNCPRLLTINEVSWARGDKWPSTHVTFSLTRYVLLAGKA